MKVLIIGSGGREHALAYKIAKSDTLEKLYIAPGNPGTAQLGENVSISSESEILDFCKSNSIDLVIVGPEIPLVEGLADPLREAGIKVFGPSKIAAQIEGDKTFSKDLMQKYSIPTAAYKAFSMNEYEEAKKYITQGSFPVVIKTSGLAAGKGVAICENLEDALYTLKEYFEDKIFGEAGENIVVEEFMEGEEASIFAITDGKDFICLPSAQDHKRVGDGDTGKNTGGMGAYSPAPLVTPELLQRIEETVIQPTLDAMRAENARYNGCLYAGLMITPDGTPKVVEFNCRFGDPETQAVLPLLDGDLLKLLYSAADGNIDKNAVSYTSGTAICVVGASAGYPGSYQKGFEITGLENFENNSEIIAYHAGTKESYGKVVSAGGRVLGITAVIKENDLKACKEKVYDAMTKVNFEGMFYRKDISDKALK